MMRILLAVVTVLSLVVAVLLGSFAVHERNAFAQVCDAVWNLNHEAIRKERNVMDFIEDGDIHAISAKYKPIFEAGCPVP